MAEAVSLSVTDASNTARFSEAQAANTVNDGARALEGMLARNIRDTQGYITSTGSANAYAIALNATTAAAAAGEEITFKANFTNSGAATINITPSGGSARGTVAIQVNGKALVGGEIVSGGFYTVRYDGTQYQLMGSAGIQLFDSNQTHKTQVVNGSNITADRTLTIAAGDADRTLTMTASASLNQDVLTTSSPQFAAVGLGMAVASSNIISGTSAADAELCRLDATHATYTGVVYRADATRAASASYSLFRGSSGDTGDDEFIVTGDGIIKSDQAATTPADYAEFFENAALGVLPLGESVVLIAGKVALASANPLLPIIGAVRPKGASAVVANSHWSRHKKGRKRDKWGAPVCDAKGDALRDDGYDKSLVYVPRADRPAEWTIIGLVGQVPVLKTAPKDARWVKMWDIDATTEMWLVR